MESRSKGLFEAGCYRDGLLGGFFGGTQLSSSTRATETGCESACDAAGAACAAFRWDVASGLCSLRSDAAWSWKADVDVVYRFATPGACPTAPICYVTSHDGYFSGSAIAGWTDKVPIVEAARSLRECLAIPDGGRNQRMSGCVLSGHQLLGCADVRLQSLLVDLHAGHLDSWKQLRPHAQGRLRPSSRRSQLLPDVCGCSSYSAIVFKHRIRKRLL